MPTTTYSPVTAPTTPVATTTTVTPAHSRAPSVAGALAAALPAYSSNRFKRRFRGVLWAVVAVLALTWIAVAKQQHRFADESSVELWAGRRGANLAVAPIHSDSSEEEEEGARLATAVTSPNEGEGDHAHLALLPVCRKTFLFRFAGLHGQGSELNLLLRLSALATRFEYTFLLDSSAWNYGPFTSYFEPLPPVLPLAFPSHGAASLQCRPPPAATKRIKVRLTDRDLEALIRDVSSDPGDTDAWIPEWARDGKHVVWGPTRDMDGLDQTILRLFRGDRRVEEDLHEADLVELRRQALGEGKPLGGLTEDETIPPAFGAAFDRLSDEVRRVWKPNARVRGMVEASERRLGLSPTSASELAAGGRRKDRRLGELVVGVHVRLGDKYLETDRIGPQAASSSPPPPSAGSQSSAASVSPYSSSYTAEPGLHESTITNYYAAAIKSINSILLVSSAAPSFEAPVGVVTTTSTRDEQLQHLTQLTEQWHLDAADEGGSGKPTLVLMSDDADAIDKFRQHPLAAKFRLVNTADDCDPDPPAVATRVDKRSEREVEPGRELDAQRMVKVVARKDPGSGRPRARDRTFGIGHGAWRPNHASPHWKVAHQPLPPGMGKDEGETKPGPFIPAGFNENTFNSLPLETRIEQSQAFVRDVTLLSTRADALVITGSSNVGRLMCLLMGDRAKGRVRSLDTRWFPTAKFA
ncbi:hypothetical protein JCM11491_006996 [Sporobolomyces phaffii]